jgi:hypothetical protein
MLYEWGNREVVFLIGSELTFNLIGKLAHDLAFKLQQRDFSSGLLEYSF